MASKQTPTCKTPDCPSCAAENDDPKVMKFWHPCNIPECPMADCRAWRKQRRIGPN